MVYKAGKVRVRLYLKEILFLLLFTAAPAMALPFNDDMVDSQIKTGQVMRPKVDGSVPLGSLNYYSEDKETATAFNNNRKPTETSIASGKRLFAVNCKACHGNLNSDPAKYKPSPVAKFVPGPNLADKLYHRGGSSVYTDGRLFATIRYGNVLMPAVGYKLSPNEMWDIVNYIRSVQED